jgi:hypothetical protein
MNGMGELLKKIGSPVLVPRYASRTAEKLSVSSEIVRREFDKYVPISFGGGESGMMAVGERKHLDGNSASPQPAESGRIQAPPSDRELWLLRFLLAGDESVEWVGQNLNLDWLQHPVVRRIVSARLALQADQSWQGVPGLLEHCEDPEAQSLITQAVAAELPSENLSLKIAETVRLLRNDFLDRQLGALRLRLTQPGLPEAEGIGILRQQAELRRAKQQPLE